MVDIEWSTKVEEEFGIVDGGASSRSTKNLVSKNNVGIVISMDGVLPEKYSLL